MKTQCKKFVISFPDKMNCTITFDISQMEKTSIKELHFSRQNELRENGQIKIPFFHQKINICTIYWNIKLHFFLSKLICTIY